jgi:O-acetyl-ADP-ribose deacetylase (regulator of RNase III)
MITIKTGDLLESNAHTLVNTVNCVGVMGKGIALAFKNEYPEMFLDYKKKCESGKVIAREPYLYKVSDDLWILNFPTKQHWRSDSNLNDIIGGLSHLSGHYEEWGIKSLAVPPLGCGNGNLALTEVGPIMVKHFSQFSIPVEIYVPQDSVYFMKGLAK